jgi:hypothetical protein
MKKTFFLKFVFSVCLIQVFNSCHLGHTFINNVPNVQTFDSSHFKMSGYLGLNHVEAQVTVPLKSWVGLQANGFISNRGKFGEIGTGFRVSPEKYKTQLYFYSGFGQADIASSFEFESTEQVFDYDMNYVRYYAMPVINYKIFEKFQVYSGLRMSLVKYNQYNFLCYDKDTKSDQSTFITDTLANIHLNDFSGSVLDPFIGCRLLTAEKNSLIIDFQIFLSYKYFNDLKNYKTSKYSYFFDSEQHPLSQGISINIGVTYNLSSKK